MTGHAGQRGNGKAVSPYYLINKGLPTCARVPLRGGTSNNGVKDGAFYADLSHDASNANWNNTGTRASGSKAPDTELDR